MFWIFIMVFMLGAGLFKLGVVGDGVRAVRYVKHHCW